MHSSVAELGVLEGEVLLFGGPYSNLSALQAVIAVAEDRGIPKERRICTGDVIAYCAEARSTWDLAVAECGVIVAGNCEQQIGAAADDCGCGFEEGTVCAVASQTWFAHASRQMADRRAACAAAPGRAVFQHGTKRYAVIHGGVRDIAAFHFSTTPEAVLQGEVDALFEEVGPVDGVICGHSGIAFERVIGGVAWINAGVIGMPPNDGRPETEYAILSEGGVSFRRLSYDVQSTVREMEKASLRQGYERGLVSGFWPAEDVLPDALKRRAEAG